jgi:poly-gamma-glutamate capsule biosynthesis protein CapA/YwtB (metallophosphatase superfamily)
MPSFLLLAFSCFTMSRRALISGLSSFVSTSKMEAKPEYSSSLRILVHGGDNMLGRAVQLSFPVQASGEELIRDSCTAAHYVDLCLDHPSGRKHDLNLKEIRALNAQKGQYLWGDYQGMQITPPPDIKLLNVETAVTKSIHNADLPEWKGIRYHMHEDNFENIMSGFCQESHGGDKAIPVVVNFANNHAMDYGRKALEEESIPLFERLKSDTFQTVGLGLTLEQASKPATIACKSTSVQVFAFAAGCSGAPVEWWATKSRSGLLGIPGLHSHQDVDSAISIAKVAVKQEPKSDSHLRIVSIHWGPNWAMKGEGEQDLAARREFAHRMIDECGVDMIYGHSSHHVRGMEVYREKLILYGAGDIINDYEGFENRGEERYNRLAGIYVVDVDANSGKFQQLQIVPMYMNRLRLERFIPSSSIWRPNQRRLEQNPNNSKDFCDFLNEISLLDAGGRENALLMEHRESDPQLPGGPVLSAFNLSHDE